MQTLELNDSDVAIVLHLNDEDGVEDDMWFEIYDNFGYEGLTREQRGALTSALGMIAVVIDSPDDVAEHAFDIIHWAIANEEAVTKDKKSQKVMEAINKLRAVKEVNDD